MDKIIITDLKLFAYHGVNPEEKTDGQNFYLDITACLDLSLPCSSDNVEDTVSYAKMIKTATRVFTAGKYDLIERAAQVVADALLEDYPQLCRIQVTVKKPEAPVKADFGNVAVQIERERNV